MCDETKEQKDMWDLRWKVREEAFKKYSIKQFKQWGADKAAELSQQLMRLGTKKYDQEELIRTALMVEDAVAMLWMLLAKDTKYIDEIKEDIYTGFEAMEKEAETVVKAEPNICMDPYCDTE